MPRRTCKNCLLPRTAPGADIDASGICALCREYARKDHRPEEALRKAHEADLEAALSSARGHAGYDVLVNLSGGKDSCYLLYRLVRDYRLKVLAFTTDMNVPPIAWDNIKRTVDKLGVDHLVHTPDQEFYRKLYRFLLQHQEERGAVRSVCYVCAPLFEGYALKTATEKQIPIVVAGYSPGQPDPERMVYEFAPRMISVTDWTPLEVKSSGLFSEEELQAFWNPRRYPPGTTFPRYLAPFHAWPYNQAEIMKKVVELGLTASTKHASPVHSNCPLNWLLMYSDLKHLHYNPYAPEFAKLIREGKASRAEWRVGLPVANAMIKTRTFMGRNVTSSLKWLGLRTSDLQITRPAEPSPTELPEPELVGTSSADTHERPR